MLERALTRNGKGSPFEVVDWLASKALLLVFKTMPTKQTPAEKKTFTITQAAKTLKISRAAVHQAIQEGRLRARLGKVVQTKVVKTVIEAWTIDAKSLKDYRVSAAHQIAGKKTK